MQFNFSKIDFLTQNHPMHKKNVEYLKNCKKTQYLREQTNASDMLKAIKKVK